MQTDNEEYEQVKSFIKDNWIAITVGVVIGVGGLLGWRYYQDHQITTQLNQASAYYTAVSKLTTPAVTENAEESAKVKNEAVDAVKTYLANDDSNLVGVAALSLAKDLASSKDFAGSEQVLVNVLPKVKDENLVATIQFMIANIQAEQEKFDEALATIEKVKLASWTANRLELKADILKRKGDIAAARKVYEEAIVIADPSLQDYLRLKLNNLPS